MTTPDAIRSYTSGILRAQAAYDHDTRCECGALVDPEAWQRRARCEDCKTDRAKAVKAAADARRDRRKTA